MKYRSTGELARCPIKRKTYSADNDIYAPPADKMRLETDVDGFIGKELLGSVISKHHHVEKIICGHIHVPINTSWNDTVISTAPSMGMQLVLDLTLKRESEFVLEAPAYHLHYWT